jgi:pimeloyl-ACP methyl ester carboxylesterase
MHMRDTGDPSRRAVLLLHGQMFDGSLYDPLVPALAGARRVLVPDLPGYGRTPLLLPWTIDGVRAAIEAELLARGVVDLDVAGYSLGGYHALALALAGRVRVGKLYLLGALAGVDADMLAAFQGYAQAVRAGTVDMAEAFAAMALPAAWTRTHAAEVDAIKAALRRVSAATLAAEFDAAAELRDLRPRLGDIRAETLVRTGSEEQNAPLALVEQMARAIPGARLEIAPGVGHLYLTQDREATVASAAAFLLG